MTMKKAETNYLRFYNFVILGLLTALGFSVSCSSQMEYGMPSATFKVNGTIEAKDSKMPIENIKVVMRGDTAFSDSNGKYYLEDKYGSPGNSIYDINFIDYDGSLNGEYKNLDTLVEFINPEFEGGDGHWYEGEITREFNVELMPKNTK